MARNDNSKAHALISYYVLRYKLTHRREPLINRYKEKWGFLDMLADLGEQESREVIDYYFSMPRADHTTLTLFKSYEKLAKTVRELKEDAANRQKLRKETEARVTEWRARGGN